jgi:hypothetical protein
MKYSFHPLAVAELNEAIDYYEDFQSGLGLEFAKEIFSKRSSGRAGPLP